MVGLRLFLPEEWTSDPERMAQARVPEERRSRADQAGNRDRGDRPRHRLRRALWLCPRRFRIRVQRVLPSGAERARSQMGGGPVETPERLSRRRRFDLSVAKAGRPRKYSIPDQPPLSAEAALAGEKWRRINWRRGAKGRPTCLFAARRVRVADGHKHRMADDRMQCMPGDEVWLVGERRSTGEQKYYVSNLPPTRASGPWPRQSRRDGCANRRINRLKEELGLDHFEGRSWIGLHRHALMTMIAYAFLQSRRLKAAGRKEKSGDHRRNRACRPSGKPSLTSSYALRLGNARTARDFSSRWPHLIRQNDVIGSQSSSALATGGRFRGCAWRSGIYTQLLGRAGERQLGGVRLGLTHNLDGAPLVVVLVAVSIFGRLH